MTKALVCAYVTAAAAALLARVPAFSETVVPSWLIGGGVTLALSATCAWASLRASTWYVRRMDRKHGITERLDSRS